jgi:WD40 repeat protein
MSQMGMGAMIHYLSGGSKHSADEYYGQKIMSADINDDALCLGLSPSGKTIKIWDNGQSCCEHRYMTTDDDVQSLVGHELRRIETKAGPDIADEYGEHEQVFVEVGTDKGFITIVNHNEHNGYYGGFGLTITEAGE